jgi:hypothetical protein
MYTMHLALTSRHWTPYEQRQQKQPVSDSRYAIMTKIRGGRPPDLDNTDVF